jgi:hypothetical protein
VTNEVVGELPLKVMPNVRCKERVNGGDREVVFSMPLIDRCDDLINSTLLKSVGVDARSRLDHLPVKGEDILLTSVLWTENEVDVNR